MALAADRRTNPSTLQEIAMDQSIEAENELPVEELTPEEMQQVAGGQNGAGTGPPH
jgi:hypothetical protein